MTSAQRGPGNSPPLAGWPVEREGFFSIIQWWLRAVHILTPAETSAIKAVEDLAEKLRREAQKMGHTAEIKVAIQRIDEAVLWIKRHLAK